MLWHISRKYSRLYARVKDRTGRNIKGLGFLLRRLHADRDFDACGFRWHFDHRIGGTYMRLVGGSFNEPETQAFLDYVLTNVERPVPFVDVGANIGEFVVSLGSDPNVSRVIGFEPHPVCHEVCLRNAQLNDVVVDLRPLVVSDGTAQTYVVDPRYAPTSGIRRDVAGVEPAPTATLDTQLAELRDTFLLLIDVEGAELDVLRGAKELIARANPLIVFEYNDYNRALYSIDQVREVLGEKYDIYRLRLDGMLDRDLSDTWNCVAAPRNNQWFQITERRLA